MKRGVGGEAGKMKPGSGRRSGEDEAGSGRRSGDEQPSEHPPRRHERDTEQEQAMRRTKSRPMGS
jgi:hypothetical protein